MSVNDEADRITWRILDNGSLVLQESTFKSDGTQLSVNPLLQNQVLTVDINVKTKVTVASSSIDSCRDYWLPFLILFIIFVIIVIILIVLLIRMKRDNDHLKRRNRHCIILESTVRTHLRWIAKHDPKCDPKTVQELRDIISFYEAQEEASKKKQLEADGFETIPSISGEPSLPKKKKSKKPKVEHDEIFIESDITEMGYGQSQQAWQEPPISIQDLAPPQRPPPPQKQPVQAQPNVKQVEWDALVPAPEEEIKPLPRQPREKKHRSGRRNPENQYIASEPEINKDPEPQDLGTSLQWPVQSQSQRRPGPSQHRSHLPLLTLPPNSSSTA
jgi:hypothetical protein